MTPSSSKRLYFSKFPNGKYQAPVRLGAAIHTPYFDVDPFVAPDESYLIFSSTHPDGKGSADLYISFKNADQSWTPAINMGAPIHTEERELCALVSRDGKCLFFTRSGKIFWVHHTISISSKKKS